MTYRDMLAKRVGSPPAGWNPRYVPESWVRPEDLASMQFLRAGIPSGTISMLLQLRRNERGLVLHACVSKFVEHGWVLPSPEEIEIAKATFDMNNVDREEAQVSCFCIEQTVPWIAEEFHAFDCGMCGQETRGNTSRDESSMLCHDCNIEFIHSRGETLEERLENMGYARADAEQRLFRSLGYCTLQEADEIARDLRELFACRGDAEALKAATVRIRAREIEMRRSSGASCMPRASSFRSSGKPSAK